MNKRRLTPVILIIALIALTVTGCAWWDNLTQEIKGTLIGDSYNIEFYDNYGAKFLNIKGDQIDLEGNYATSYDYDGTTVHELSSVVTVTVDGNSLETTGSTVIFEGKGLKKLVDYSLNDIDSESKGGILQLTSVAKNVNEFKNMQGKSAVVIIQSQMGVPICAYEGDSVYWEIPGDLPKTTKLMIDGKPLYIHRANYVLVDKSLL